MQTKLDLQRSKKLYLKTCVSERSSSSLALDRLHNRLSGARTSLPGQRVKVCAPLLTGDSVSTLISIRQCLENTFNQTPLQRYVCDPINDAAR